MTNVDINTLGLIFDIIGVIILFKFGLPSDVNKYGEVSLLLEDNDTDEIKKWRRYDCWSKIGLISILFGFILQIVSNYI